MLVVQGVDFLSPLLSPFYFLLLFLFFLIIVLLFCILRLLPYSFHH